MTLSPAQVYQILNQHLGGWHEGQEAVVARSPEGVPLVASWYDMEALLDPNGTEVSPASRQIKVDIPDPPPKSRVDQWFAASAGHATVTGYGSVSMDFAPTFRTAWDALPNGLRLMVYWKPGNTTRHYDFQWINPEPP